MPSAYFLRSKHSLSVMPLDTLTIAVHMQKNEEKGAKEAKETDRDFKENAGTVEL